MSPRRTTAARELLLCCLALRLSLPLRSVEFEERERRAAFLHQGGIEVHRGGSEVRSGGSEVDRVGSEVDRGGSEVDRGGSEVDRGGSKTHSGGSEVNSGGSEVHGDGSEVYSSGGQVRTGSSDRVRGGSASTGNGAYSRLTSSEDDQPNSPEQHCSRSNSTPWASPWASPLKPSTPSPLPHTSAALSVCHPYTTGLGLDE